VKVVTQIRKPGNYGKVARYVAVRLFSYSITRTVSLSYFADFLKILPVLQQLFFVLFAHAQNITEATKKVEASEETIK